MGRTQVDAIEPRGGLIEEADGAVPALTIDFGDLSLGTHTVVPPPDRSSGGEPRP